MTKSFVLCPIGYVLIVLLAAKIDAFSTTLTTKKVNGVLQMAASDDSSSSQAKNLILIRHGLSYMNEYIGANGISFGAPNFTDIFSPEDMEKYYRDTPLSPTGQKQAKELGKSITSLLKEGSCLRSLDLIVVSPLTRAIQTAQLGLFPYVLGSTSSSKSPIPIIAQPLAAERLYLVSDIGRPKAELEARYGNQIDFSSAFPEEPNAAWWYEEKEGTRRKAPEWRPIGEGQIYFCPGEPYDVFEQRMRSLFDCLESRPERNIALVGHYGVFEWLLQGEHDHEKVKFSNCELRIVPFETIAKRAGQTRNLL